MPKKITYLLGAGASANALPTIKTFGKNPGLSASMRNLSKSLDDMIKRIDKNEDFNIKPENEEIAKGFSSDLKDLAEKSDSFVTIDSLAKYYYIVQDTTELKRLKKTLSIYFTIEQVQKKYDKRYVVFLTSILDQNKNFPENIKIITWNYDFQMQLAAQKFVSQTSSTSIIHFYPNDGSYTNTNKHIDLVHLNGIAGFYLLQGQPKFSRYLRNEYNINECLSHIKNHSDVIDLLKFAWEKENENESSYFLRESIRHRRNIIRETEILIIIGYSFPFFNREIDNDLFQTMKLGGLRKIYYQDPISDGKFLKNQFDLASNVEIEHIDKVDNFFLPLEL